MLLPNNSTAVEVLLGTEVKALEDDQHLERVVVEQIEGGTRRTLAAGVLVVLIGAAAHTDWLAGKIALDEAGFAPTGPAPPDLRTVDPWKSLGRNPFLFETSRPGVFALGDIRAGSTKMVSGRRRRRHGRSLRRRAPRTRPELIDRVPLEASRPRRWDCFDTASPCPPRSASAG